MRFEWDPDKAARNREIHGITFEEATELFTSGDEVLEIYDLANSASEDRFKSLGPICSGIIVVVWTEREEDTIRIISAWPATKKETALYREFLEGNYG